MRHGVKLAALHRRSQTLNNRWGYRAIVLALLTCGLLGITNSPTAAAEEEIVDLAQVTFVTSPKWYVIKRIALDGDALVFRKYSFSVIEGEVGGIEKTKNIFDFGCQRNSRYSDYLVFHLPSWARSGLENNSWVPRLSLNVALNGLSVTFDAEGEYKNSSIFIDLNDRQLQNLFKLIAADEIVIDYGVSGGRLRIEQRMLTPDGEGDIAKFIEDFVINILSPSIAGGKVIGFNTDSLLKACLAYKRNGRLP